MFTGFLSTLLFLLKVQAKDNGKGHLRLDLLGCGPFRHCWFSVAKILGEFFVLFCFVFMFIFERAEAGTEDLKWAQR